MWKIPAQLKYKKLQEVSVLEKRGTFVFRVATRSQFWGHRKQRCDGKNAYSWQMIHKEHKFITKVIQSTNDIISIVSFSILSKCTLIIYTWK